jgi:hypothetical protein
MVARLSRLSGISGVSRVKLVATAGRISMVMSLPL